MPRTTVISTPKFLVDEKGHKKGIVLNPDEYESLMELIDDLEDANDLLKPEREPVDLTPYEQFRKTWLKE